MLKLNFWTGMLTIAFASAVALSGCRREEESPVVVEFPVVVESPLIGAWVNDTGLEKQFHRNGNWEISVEGTPNVRGTFSIDGNTITRRMTHLHGGVFENLEPIWYSEQELNSAINRNWEELFSFSILIPFERQTEIYIYSISGDTVSFTYTGTDWDDDYTFTETFTRRR